MTPAGKQMLIGAGQVIVGGGTLTVTVNEHDCVPQLFDAVQVTVVVPIGNVEPDARSHETDVPMPLPAGVAKVTAAPLADVAPVVIFVGQVIAGLSFTVTTNEHVASPAELAARQFTVVVPSGKLEPEAGVQLTVTPVPVVVGAA